MVNILWLFFSIYVEIFVFSDLLFIFCCVFVIFSHYLCVSVCGNVDGSFVARDVMCWRVCLRYFG